VQFSSLRHDAMLKTAETSNPGSSSFSPSSNIANQPARMAAPTANASAACQALNTLQAQILQHRDNLTALRTIQAPGFVNSPGFRGTTDILYSCVVTLVACIYTALHLNVPAKSSLGYTLAYKGKWVFIGLIAPELVLYLAILQFAEACSLVKELNKLLKTDASFERKKPKPGDVEVGIDREDPERAQGNRASSDGYGGAQDSTPGLNDSIQSVNSDSIMAATDGATTSAVTRAIAVDGSATQNENIRKSELAAGMDDDLTNNGNTISTTRFYTQHWRAAQLTRSGGLPVGSQIRFLCRYGRHRGSSS